MEMLWTWLLSFFFILTLLCILGYQLVCLVDLEFDYINPYDSSSRINNTVLPEFIVQGVLCVILLITRHWFMLLLALPHLYYNVNSQPSAILASMSYNDIMFHLSVPLNSSPSFQSSFRYLSVTLSIPMLVFALVCI